MLELHCRAITTSRRRQLEPHHPQCPGYGATSGIGQAIAESLAAARVRVIVSGRDATRANAVVKAIQNQGGEVSFWLLILPMQARHRDSPIKP